MNSHPENMKRLSTHLKNQMLLTLELYDIYSTQVIRAKKSILVKEKGIFFSEKTLTMKEIQQERRTKKSGNLNPLFMCSLLSKQQ